MATVMVGGRRRRSREEWQAVFERFAASGQGVERFCEGEGISKTSFARWRSRLCGQAGRPGGEALAAAPGFVDAGWLGQRAAGRIELRLDLGGGLVLHLVRD